MDRASSVTLLLFVPFTSVLFPLACIEPDAWNDPGLELLSTLIPSDSILGSLNIPCSISFWARALSLQNVELYIINPTPPESMDRGSRRDSYLALFPPTTLLGTNN